MPLAYSTASPAAKQSGYLGTQNATIVSNTFSPPANSTIIVVIEAVQSFTVGWNTPTITDSLTSHLSWNVALTQANNTFSSGALWVGWANCSSAQTNMTVSVTIGVVDNSQYVTTCLLTPLVYTGASLTAPLTNVSLGTNNTTSLAVSMTPLYSGSHLYLNASRTASSVTASTAGAGTYQTASWSSGAAYSVAWFGTSSGPDYSTAASAQTLSLTSVNSGNAWQYIAFELISSEADSIPLSWITSVSS